MIPRLMHSVYIEDLITYILVEDTFPRAGYERHGHGLSLLITNQGWRGSNEVGRRRLHCYPALVREQPNRASICYQNSFRLARLRYLVTSSFAYIMRLLTTLCPICYIRVLGFLGFACLLRSRAIPRLVRILQQSLQYSDPLSPAPCYSSTVCLYKL